MKELQDAKWQLTQLKANPGTQKVIQKVVCVMQQHLDMDKLVQEWRKKSTPDKKVERLQKTFPNRTPRYPNKFCLQKTSWICK